MNTGYKHLQCALDIYREKRYDQIYKMHNRSRPSVFSVRNSTLIPKNEFNAFQEQLNLTDLYTVQLKTST